MSKPATESLDGLVLGIDATNLRSGGGRTHLIELLRHADVYSHGFSRVVVWGSRQTLALLDDADWLLKQSPSALSRGMLSRSLWQCLRLSNQARHFGCDILFIPGGSFAGDFSPVVAMSQNMLPFEQSELWRYGFSITSLRLLFLRWLQASTFERAQGLIFLSGYAHRLLHQLLPKLSDDFRVIPHGLNARFRRSPRPQWPIASYSLHRPYRILYVSSIDPYKHQWNLLQAVAELRLTHQWPLALDLVGTAYSSSFRRLKRAISRYDKLGQWVTYHGAIDYECLHSLYHKSDLGVFASTCENMPNILVETMSAGLPIACSHSGPMPEILGSSGVYFDPLSPSQISAALQELIADPSLRSRLASQSFDNSGIYSWTGCASDTFGFLATVAAKSRDRT